MSARSVREFSEADLPAAARLLGARHERHRAAQPLLGPIDPRGAVERAWADATGGLVAHDGDEVQGYLLWRLRENAVWGRFAWIDRADHAATDPEAIRDLYAVGAGDWVDLGVVRHGAVVPALPAELDPWERLAFARMQVHALRALPDEPPPADPRIRRSGPEGVDADVAPFARSIWEHQAATPAFTGLAAPTWDELRADWIETLEEPGSIHLVLEEDEAAIGHALVYPADDELGWPPATVRLAVVSVTPHRRGRGVGRALTQAAFREARQAGFEVIETDWRITNLLSSRAWPAMGFETVFHRLWRVTGTG